MSANALSEWGQIPDQLYESAASFGSGISPMQFLEAVGLVKADSDKKSPGIANKNSGIHPFIKSFTENPYEVYSSRGIRERFNLLSYSTLRAIETKNPVISAIVNCRCCQLRPFAAVSKDEHEPGFRIRLKDSEKKPTSRDREMMRYITEWVLNAGRTDFDGWMDREDDLLTVMEKGARDLLTIDKMCTELRYDQAGKIVDFWAVDGATIRRVVQTGYTGSLSDFDPRAFNTQSTDLAKDMMTAKFAQIPEELDKIKFVQRINGRLVAAYERKDLLYDCMQKRSDINFAGEGYPKPEQALHVITAFLFALAYNAEQFNTGTIPKIALAFKEGNFSEPQLVDLQDQWIANFRGIKGAWRIPMFNQEVQVIDLLKSAKDMEHSKYMEFTGSLMCAIYSIDPQEIGMRWQYAQSVLNENQGARLKFSKDRGLNDLLGQLANHLNRIMYFAGWGSRYVLEFTGVEPDDAKSRSQLENEAVKRDTTVNELRKSKDKPAIKGGDIILDPTFLQNLQNTQGQQAQDGEDEGGSAFGGGADSGIISEAGNEAIDEIFKAARKVRTARTLLI